MTEIRWDRPQDQPAIRAFLARVGFLVRPRETWSALGMSAATAWRDGELVGAIPLEPRPVKLGAAKTLRCLQQTTVAVEPALRGRGIGSALQDFIAAAAAEAGGRAQAATVYREEPDSPGYRWYRRNGFAPLQRLRIWSHGGSGGGAPLRIAAWNDPAVPLAEIEALRLQQDDAGSGLTVVRAARPLAHWLPVHPYARAWRFEIAWSAAPLAYALLGRAEEGRRELLESGVAAEGPVPRRRLIEGLIAAGPLRCMLAESDAEAIAALEATGFTRQSAMDLLAKPLAAGVSLEIDEEDRARWRHHAIDYV